MMSTTHRTAARTHFLNTRPKQGKLNKSMIPSPIKGLYYKHIYVLWEIFSHQQQKPTAKP